MPEPGALVREIEAHQRRMDELHESYTFREVTQTEDLDSHSGIRRTTREDRDVFFVNGYRVARLVLKNGKELSDTEQKAEQERIAKAIDRDISAPHGHAYNRRGENVGVSQILPLMKISNPRRIVLKGRSTLTYDFIGDPHAKSHGLAEYAARKIAGTVWIDEADREVARLEARFDENFRIGAGFVANIWKGTSLIFEQSRLDRNYGCRPSARFISPLANYWSRASARTSISGIPSSAGSMLAFSSRSLLPLDSRMNTWLSHLFALTALFAQAKASVCG